MPQKGIKRGQVRVETPKTLHEYADELDQQAKSLHNTAENMLKAGIGYIVVRYSPGARKQLVKAIKPFVLDAERKANQAGA